MWCAWCVGLKLGEKKNFVNTEMLQFCSETGFIWVSWEGWKSSQVKCWLQPWKTAGVWHKTRSRLDKTSPVHLKGCQEVLLLGMLKRLGLLLKSTQRTFKHIKGCNILGPAHPFLGRPELCSNSGSSCLEHLKISEGGLPVQTPSVLKTWGFKSFFKKISFGFGTKK